MWVKTHGLASFICDICVLKQLNTDSMERPVITAEQQAILDSNENIRINAVAGSGKTTTLIAYAKTRPAGSRILYLAFNRSVKLEASRRFEEEGLPQVRVETAHSLAYRAIIPGSRYRVRMQQYKSHEIVALLQLQGSGEKHTEYILATHILRFITYFCNSAARKVQELNYIDVVTDKNARKYVKQHYAQIERGTRLILAQMDTAQIDITHDFYLKKFQLSQPALPYDYILFDEGQDASGAMLDIFLQQPSIKVIVGDTHQQIYGWRHAVNSLEQTSFRRFRLSTSFRFYPSHAELATQILAWKNKADASLELVEIIGKGQRKERKTKATLARTNLGLLLAAVDYSSDPRNPRKIYFEGNINSYTYADDGASLYDVLNLQLDQRDRIRDPLVSSMHSLGDLEDYVEKTEDQQMGMMVELVKEYGNQLPAIIRELKDMHIGDEDRDKAAMIFSTVHRAKGMEYDEVFLASDFVNEKKLDRWLADKENVADKNKLNEEINLLYVAVTRTRHWLHIPESLLPVGFPPKPHIQVLKPEEKKKTSMDKPISRPYWKQRLEQELQGQDQRFRQHKGREKRSVNNSGTFWTDERDEELRDLYERGISIAVIAEEMNCNKGAIVARLKKFDHFQ